MEAVVTLKATTQELDLLRAALGSHADVQRQIIDEAPPAQRPSARAELMRTHDLLASLGKGGRQ